MPSWRTYTSDTAVNLINPVLKIGKGAQVILDVEGDPDQYFVIYKRSSSQKEKPIKFRVSALTWNKIARNSELP